MDLVTVAPQRTVSLAEPGLVARPLTPMEVALLRMLDTADAIEAGRLPAHLCELPAVPNPVPAPAVEPDEPSWVMRVRNVVAVWAVVAALGVVALEVAPGPPRPHLAPAPPARVHTAAVFR